ncbi:MAG: AmmeMemoRadiSam system protein B [Candidatus Omnitrophota bacterium]|nr:AmmeMemoRadiSam system protein B [Candidatus Omnitrophota bacterium]
MFKRIFFLIQIFVFLFYLNSFASSVKEPEFAGQFYPGQKDKLSTMIDNFLIKAQPKDITGDIFMLISPHAGFGYSGPTAAYGYKLIKNKPYKTVIILGTSHHKPFNGAAVYTQGSFETSLGILKIDDEFSSNLINRDPDIFADETAFSGEHSVEVQLPFLQSVLGDFKIVPVVIGDCSLVTCKKIASLFKEAIGTRKDILLVVSTDLYHGYDILEADKTDMLTLELIKKMDYEGLYYSLRDTKAQACGGFATVIALNIAKEAGYDLVEVLNHTNSAVVTGQNVSGQWTVGYASIIVYNPAPRAYWPDPIGMDRHPPRVGELRGYALVGKGENMLNNQQRKKLLEIARASINTYLQTGKKMEFSETDPVLKQEMGAFVTLDKHGELRGCIGNLTANQPLYLTIRDMAVEAAVHDPRFSALTLLELKDIDIEISALSPLKRVDSAERIELGKHGVFLRKGYQSGVFLPQVATETGWSKEEFLNNLCAQKAGLAPDAWKDKSTELYIFEAEVFSESKIKE